MSIIVIHHFLHCFQDLCCNSAFSNLTMTYTNMDFLLYSFMNLKSADICLLLKYLKYQSSFLQIPFSAPLSSFWHIYLTVRCPPEFLLGIPQQCSSVPLRNTETLTLPSPAHRTFGAMGTEKCSFKSCASLTFFGKSLFVSTVGQGIYSSVL